jgi:hypothetical protein
MQRSRTNPQSGNGSKRNSENENLGFLGGQESGKQNARRQQRFQKFKNASQPQPLNTGTSGTIVVNSNQDSSNPVQVQPGNLSQNIALPADIQEKINRWREKRQQKALQQQQGPQPMTTADGQYTDSNGNSFFSNSEDLDEVKQLESHKTIRGKFIRPTPHGLSQIQTQPHPQPVIQLHPQPQPHPQPVIQLHPQPPVKNVVNVNTVPVSKEYEKSQTIEPLRQQSPQLQASPVSIFDPSHQEIMRGQVEFEVKRVLDQLKKERPELVNQAEVMNIVNQKTRKFEESLQQFNVREQRLRDMVDQMNVTIKAVQSNVDHTKTENGGQFVTEEVMRSWVSFFISEQMGAIKNELHSDVDRITEKLTSASSQRSLEVKTLENNIRLLETKFQNTLQAIFEVISFIYGTVLTEVSTYEQPDAKSKELARCKVDEKLMLQYPIYKAGNDRWMKVRTVNSETAQIGDAWVPILLNQIPYVGNFSMA